MRLQRQTVVDAAATKKKEQKKERDKMSRDKRRKENDWTLACTNPVEGLRKRLRRDEDDQQDEDEDQDQDQDPLALPRVVQKDDFKAIFDRFYEHYLSYTAMDLLQHLKYLHGNLNCPYLSRGPRSNLAANYRNSILDHVADEKFHPRLLCSRPLLEKYRGELTEDQKAELERCSKLKNTPRNRLAASAKGGTRRGAGPECARPSKSGEADDAARCPFFRLNSEWTQNEPTTQELFCQYLFSHEPLLLHFHPEMAWAYFCIYSLNFSRGMFCLIMCLPYSSLLVGLSG